MPEVRYFAAAREAAGVRVETVGPQSAVTVGALVDELGDRHGPDLKTVLQRCSLLVDGVTLRPVGDREVRLSADCTVDVLPPFAGG